MEGNREINFPFISFCRQRMTALILAAAKGHFEIVQYLLDQGARINAKDELKRDALTLAVMNGNIKIASFLLKQYILWQTTLSLSLQLVELT